MKIPNFGTKNETKMQRNKETKMPKFGTKMPYLGNFGLEFGKNMVIFEITVLEFILLQSLVQK